MKEIRVYAINVDFCNDEIYAKDLSNEDFIYIAEKQGTVYSLKGFEYNFNNEYIDTTNFYIRFIEVDGVAESINSEEWNIPTIKINE